MTGTTSFSPLHTDYEEKYQDRPRMEVIGLLEFPYTAVLEIGCGAGATGQEVKRAHPGVTYTGIEIDPQAASEARKVLDQVFTGNVERMRLEEYGVQKHSFDVIICADVLEHLYDPWSIVSAFHEYLKPGGRVVASIPNVQNIRLLQNLVGGRWAYSNQGLLDATHIRFFTLQSIVEMFVRNGYQIEQIISSCDADMPAGGTWPSDLDLGRVVIRNVTAEQLQQIYTFQYLVRAQSRVGDGGVQ
jgi:2-polyprenyl-3-methyl-5-hydroxy-6-metoxy-1,4-benzoquinol methylase